MGGWSGDGSEVVGGLALLGAGGGGGGWVGGSRSEVISPAGRLDVAECETCAFLITLFRLQYQIALKYNCTLCLDVHFHRHPMTERTITFILLNYRRILIRIPSVLKVV